MSTTHVLDESRDAAGVDFDLNKAAAAGDAAGVRRALNCGANPNALVQFRHSSIAETAILRAAGAGNAAEVVEILLAAGASIHARSGDGYDASLLGIAAGHGDVDLCRVLVKNGASVDEISQDEMLPLHIAANNGRGDVCRFLVDAGADLYALHGEYTALHDAAKNGHLECCKVLVELGLSSSYKAPDPDEFYLTPFQLAVRYGVIETSAFFVEHCGENVGQTTLSGVDLLDLPFNDKARLALRSHLLAAEVARAVNCGGDHARDAVASTPARKSAGMSPI